MGKVPSIRVPQAAPLKVEVIAVAHWDETVTIGEFCEKLRPGFISAHRSAVIVMKHPLIVSILTVICEKSLNVHTQMNRHPHTLSCPHTSQV